jgi:VCBS repeat-containing protein
MSDRVTIVFNADPGTYTYGGVAYTRTSDTTTFTYESVLTGLTSMGSSPFYNKDKLVSIVIPSSVTSISEYTFSGCTRLTSVTFVGTSLVTSIGAVAFYNCTSLQSIVIPSLVTSIDYNAFFNCSSLSSITIPPSVTSIGDDAFTLVPASATFITNDRIVLTFNTNPGAYTYDGITYIRVTSTTYISPTGITSIGVSSFQNRSTLISIVIPDSVTSIGASAFSGCTGLTSIIIPSSVTSIGNNAFYLCSGLLSINVASSNTTYSSDGTCLFNKLQTTLIQYPIGLSGTYIIPSSVTSIGNNAFYGCTGLTMIVIPSSVTSIGNNAFYGVPLSATIITDASSGIIYTTFPGEEYTLIQSNFILQFSGTAPTTSEYTVVNTNFLYYNGVITSIPNTFSYNMNLINVFLYDDITSIGIQAFQGCTGLTSINIPFSVTSIGNSAFTSCTGLASIVIPSSVTSIGTSVFQGCTGLTSIVIPSSVTSIDNSIFEGCSGLTSVTFSETASVASIGNYAFYGCTGLTTITIPSSVMSIGTGAFQGCTGLTQMAIASPSSMSSFNDIIWGSALSNVSSLIELFLPSNITTITLTGNYPNLTLFTDGDVSLSRYTALSGKVKEIIHNIYVSPWVPIYIVHAIISAPSSYNIMQTSDPNQTVGGKLNISTNNRGGSGFTIQTGVTGATGGVTYGTFRIDASGNWLFTMNNAHRELTAQQIISLPFEVIGYDGPSRASTTITVTITGSYDASTLSVTTGHTAYNLTYNPQDMSVTNTTDNVTGITTSLSGALTINTVDSNDSSVFTVQTNAVGTYGTFSIGSTGLWQYDLSINTIRALNGGVVRTDSFTCTTVDNTGGHTAISQLITFNITGANTPSNITDSTSLSVAYNSSTSSFGVTHTYNITDPNINEAFFNAVVSATNSANGYGTYTLSSIGTFNYTLNSISGATASDTYTDSVTIYSVDNTSFTISITIDPQSLYDTNNSEKLIAAGFTLNYFVGQLNAGNISVSFISNLLTAGFSLTEIKSSHLTCVLISVSTNSFSKLNTSINEVAYTYINTVGSYDNYVSLINRTSIALSGSTALYSVNIPNSVTSIGASAFQGCTGLSTIVIPSSVTSIGASAFQGCTSLTSISIPSSVTSIGTYAFNGCTSLLSIVIPYSVMSIGANSFQNCSVLSTVDIQSSSITIINEQTFSGCTRLSSVTFASSSSVNSIGNSAFYGCSILSAVSIPSSVTIIGNSAFYGCAGLSVISIPYRVTSIGNNVFSGCIGLRSIIIPPSVTVMGTDVFSGCINLSLVNSSSPAAIADAITSSTTPNIELSGNVNIMSQLINGSFKIQSKKLKIKGKGNITG